ncbi:MAG: CsiV family protein [Gammaproteobacteria bacterium]
MRRYEKRLPHFFLLVALSCLFGYGTPAAAQWYQVELIVFAQSGNSNESFRQTDSLIEWPYDLQELTEASLPLENLRQNPQAFVALQRDDWSLATADQTLRLQGGYRILLHTAWLQTLDYGWAATAVHIHGGGRSGEDDVINGFVRIESGDPLYLLADLEYSPAPQDTEQPVYRLRERRALRLGDAHYLDHPKFGVLCLVSPLQ